MQLSTLTDNFRKFKAKQLLYFHLFYAIKQTCEQSSLKVVSLYDFTTFFFFFCIHLFLCVLPVTGMDPSFSLLL